MILIWIEIYTAHQGTTMFLYCVHMEGILQHSTLLMFLATFTSTLIWLYRR